MIKINNKYNFIVYFIQNFSINDSLSDARVEVKEILNLYYLDSFRKVFLMIYTSLNQTSLEKIDSNEYLKILEYGYKIEGVMISTNSLSLNTENNLKYITQNIEDDKIYHQYKF